MAPFYIQVKRLTCHIVTMEVLLGHKVYGQSIVEERLSSLAPFSSFRLVVSSPRISNFVSISSGKFGGGSYRALDPSLMCLVCLVCLVSLCTIVATRRRPLPALPEPFGQSRTKFSAQDVHLAHDMFSLEVELPSTSAAHRIGFDRLN